MNNVRAILIDPFKCKVEQIEHDASNYRKIYEVLSHETMNVSSFEVVYPDLASRDCVYVDAQGLLKPTERFFTINGYKYPLAGKGLILGSGSDGETASAATQLSDLNIAFLQRQGQQLVQANEPWTKVTGSPQFTIQHVSNQNIQIEKV
jgi:hypothetical protein